MDHSEVKHLPKVDHTPAEMDEANQRLLRGAAYMEAHGHCKHIVRDEHGRVCFIGALSAVGGGGFSKACDRMDAAVGMNAIHWNNADERTPAEVIAKMRAVALGIV